MGIKANQSASDIQRQLLKEMENVERNIEYFLTKIGESCVRLMRNGSEKSGKDYKDHSGNLRSSCGYAIAKDGRIINVGGFVGKGDEGKATGKNIAIQIAENKSVGGKYSFVLVAGMNYASYVQAMGYDVMESAELNAIKLVNELKTKDLTKNLRNGNS